MHQQRRKVSESRLGTGLVFCIIPDAHRQSHTRNTCKVLYLNPADLSAQHITCVVLDQRVSRIRLYVFIMEINFKLFLVFHRCFFLKLNNFSIFFEILLCSSIILWKTIYLNLSYFLNK